MTEEYSSDRFLEESFSAEFRVLNANLPKLRKPLAELMKEEHPCVLLNDGSAHFLSAKSLSILSAS